MTPACASSRSFAPPEYASFLVQVGPAGALDCAAATAYAPYLRDHRSSVAGRRAPGHAVRDRRGRSRQPRRTAVVRPALSVASGRSVRWPGH